MQSRSFFHVGVFMIVPGAFDVDNGQCGDRNTLYLLCCPECFGLFPFIFLILFLDLFLFFCFLLFFVIFSSFCIFSYFLLFSVRFLFLF